MQQTIQGKKRLTSSEEGSPLLANGAINEDGYSTTLKSQVSLETMQTHRAPSPPVNLDTDGSSLCGDSINASGRYDTFINKTATPSMSNFANFDSSSEIGGDDKNLPQSVSRKRLESEKSHGQFVIDGANVINNENLISDSDITINQNDEIFEDLTSYADSQMTSGAGGGGEVDVNLSVGWGDVSIKTGEEESHNSREVTHHQQNM